MNIELTEKEYKDLKTKAKIEFPNGYTYEGKDEDKLPEVLVYKGDCYYIKQK